MKISADEQQAIRDVVAFGRMFGYGNMISHLQTEWAKERVSDGLNSKRGAKVAGLGISIPDARGSRRPWRMGRDSVRYR